MTRRQKGSVMKILIMGALLAVSALAVVIESPLIVSHDGNEVLCKDTGPVDFAANKKANSDGNGL